MCLLSYYNRVSIMSKIQYFYVFCHNGRLSRQLYNSTGAAIYGQRVELFGILQVCAVRFY